MTDDRSRPSDRGTELEAEYRRVSERIERLEEAIGELNGAATLRPDAAARLASYRHSHERRLFELRRLEWEMRARPALEPDSPVAGATDAGRPVPTVADELLKQAGNKRKKRRGWLRL
jgi:hypothetical protein